MSKPPIYLHLKPEIQGLPLRQSEVSRVLLIAEAPVSAQFRAAVCYELVRGNCLYLMAWGTHCEAWHDAVDMANIEAFDFKEIPEERFVMTTWHADEPLKEALWYCKNNAFHSTVEIKSTVLLHVVPEEREQTVLQQYAVA